MGGVVTRNGSFHFCFLHFNPYVEEPERKPWEPSRNEEAALLTLPRTSGKTCVGAWRAGPQDASTCACRSRFFPGDGTAPRGAREKASGGSFRRPLGAASLRHRPGVMAARSTLRIDGNGCGSSRSHPSRSKRVSPLIPSHRGNLLGRT